MDTKHEINKAFSCEHCKIYHASQNFMKDHIELHKLEENEQQSSQGNFNISSENQDGPFENFYQGLQKKTCLMTVRMTRFIVRVKAKTDFRVPVTLE